MRYVRLFVVALMAVCAIYVRAAGITVHANNRPASEVFGTIMSQSGKNFVYKADLLKGVKVTVNATGASLENVLADMFEGTGITYRIRGNNILLVTRPANRPMTGTINGFVREDGNGEPLVGVFVSIDGGRYHTTTNTMGFYSVTVPRGTHSVSATYPGYEKVIIEPLSLAGSRSVDISMKPQPTLLGEVEVVATPNRALAMESASIGTLKVSKAAITSTPVIFGESDVIKTLQMEPGVSAGVEGMAGMYVHGGNTDENMYMLDNIPLYQVNHFGGLFSAFNVEALRNVDFYKSTFPARYDGRLSSYIDVNTKDGSTEAHHGSVKLGLTSGAVNVDGPLWRHRTTYSVALRRSWYDVLTLPACTIWNSLKDDEKNTVGYAFTDLNAKVTHRFNDRSKAYAMVYYGEDYLKVNQQWDYNLSDGDFEKENNGLRWGNIVAGAGWNYVLTPKLFGEFTGAWSRYFSRMTSEEEYGSHRGDLEYDMTRDHIVTDNHINDWILKADFDWQPSRGHRLGFGAGYTFHSFLPSHSRRTLTADGMDTSVADLSTRYSAGELNIYGGGDWEPADAVRVNYGVHYSLFRIGGKNHQNLSPRLGARWKINENWVVKGGYARTVQYVHQLLQSSISLPTDQWVPVTASGSPQTADKISAGFYFTFARDYTVSVEGYWKWMDNLVDYADEYYLLPPTVEWDSKLTTGKGRSRGIDLKISREYGRLTGHIAYSLLWADRRFENRNGGRWFPARFDNRHKINVMVNWKINDRWEMSAAWTGMSGNRFTLPTQVWDDPLLGPWHYDMILGTDVNNYRLPFYHRLDVSFKRNTRRGYWTFALYNAYCNMNTIGVRRDYSDRIEYDKNGNIMLLPAFQKIKLIPLIPSVSYTWIF